MMAKKEQVPVIRFQGFADPWEQRKFEDAFAERREKTERENEDTLLSCAINGMFLNSELFGHFRGTTTIGYLRVKKNDLILSAQNLHLGNANVNLRFEHGIISPAYKVYDLIDCNPEFIQAWVKKEDTKNFFLAATTEGASQCRKNIEWATLGKQTIAMPSLQEQTELGAFFTHLDNLITLHQRKYDKLVAIKRSMLEKMFPREGSCFPEIRFAGFTDPWEQRKLGELCNITTGKLDANAMVSDGQYDFYTSGIDVFKIDVAAFEGPAITIAGNGASVGYMHLADGKFNAYQRTYVLTDFLADRQFLNVAIGNELPNKIQEEVRGSGIPYIVLNMLTDLAIPFPSHEEQYAIGVYFQQLDNLITLHQRKLEKLQAIKRSMLEKMFV